MGGFGNERRSGGELDGFRIGQVPAGTGELVTDFTSEWDDVRFVSRMWERETAEGARVDLRVHVLRGDRLATLGDLRDFLAEYHERDPAEWALTEFHHGEAPGLMSATEAFWLVEPGVAVDTLVDPELAAQQSLMTFVRSVAPAY